MKIVQLGEEYNFYDDSVRTFDRLPTKTYTVEYEPRKGCFLVEHAPLVVTEKAYGVQESKVEKVMNGFERFERSLGVILSGEKGIGKTMFAKKLCMRALEGGVPIILVEEYHPGLVRFIEKIEQECVVFFDEFEKTFGAYREDDDDEQEENDQAKLLSLFDGTAGGKKLYVITCNDLYGLNDCLLNRPGRFHYHFRFDHPSDREIEEYMSDKLEKAYHGEIPKIVDFAKRMRLSYDCLRAIAFELNGGTEFCEAIEDLNVINTDVQNYDVTLYFKNGKKLYDKHYKLDLFDETEPYGWITCYNEAGKFGAEVKFSKSMVRYDAASDAFCVGPDGFFVDDSDSSYEGLKPDRLIFVKSKARNLHYFG